MTRFTKLASIFALALFVLALPSIASAQGRNRDRDRDDDYYGRDDDYNQNGRYSNRNIRGTIESLKNRARNFERRTDRIDDRRNDRDDRNDRYDPYGRNDRYDPYGRNVRYSNIEELADRFARATDDLADAYGRGRNMDNSRDEARRVLDIGSQIENVLYRNGDNRRNGSGAWNQIGRDLRIIADAYRLNYNNGNRNRTNGSGDWRNRVPFPLPF